MVGLGNCNNTSDESKPISTATQAAINDISSAVASLAVGAFSGTTTINADLYVYGKIGQGTNTPESSLHITGNRKNVPNVWGTLRVR